MTKNDAINDMLAQATQGILPEHMSIRYVAITDIREQDLNAQSMTKQMFDQLVANIEQAGAPESLPLCATIEGEGDTIWMVSGHHRKRAAEKAGITHMLILLWEGLSWDRVRSKQLAHNSIFGTSDPELVKKIWDQIDDVGARFEAFIDPRMFDQIPETVSFKPVDVNFSNQIKTVVLAFIPIQKMDFDAALEAMQEKLPKGDLDAVYLADVEAYEQWMAVLQRVRADLDIVSLPTAVAAMARLANERLEEMAVIEAEE